MAERHVLYKAISDFSRLRKDAKRARKELQALKRDADFTSESLDSTFGEKVAKNVKELRGEVKKTTKELGQLELDLELDVTADTDNLKSSVQKGLKEAKAQADDIEVPVDADTSGMRRDVAAGIRRAERGQKIEIPVEAKEGSDGGGGRGGLLGILQGFGGLSKRQVGGGLLQGLLGTIKIPAILTGLNLVSSAISALGVLVVQSTASLGRFVGVLGSVPAAVMAFAGSIGAALLATRGMGDALGELTSQAQEQRDSLREMAGVADDVRKVESAFDAVAVSARPFVQRLYEASSVLAALKESAAAGLFPGLTVAFENVISQSPQALGMISMFSRALGQAAVETSQLFIDPEFMADLNTLAQQGARLVGIFATAFGSVIRALVDVGVAAEPMTRFLSQAVETFGNWIERAAEAGRESGRLESFFERSVETVRQWGRIVSDVFAGVYNFFKAVTPYTDSFTTRMELAADRFRDFTESAEGQNSFKEFFENAQPSIDATIRLFGELFRMFGRLSEQEGLAPVLDQVRTQLLPVIEQVLEQVGSAFGPALINLISQVALAFGTLAGTSGPLTVYVRVLGSLGEALNFLLQNVPGLANIIFLFTTLAAAAKATQLAAAVLGIKRLIGMVGKIPAVFKSAAVAVTAFNTAMAKGAWTQAGGGASLAASIGTFAAAFPVLTAAIAAATVATGFFLKRWFDARREAQATEQRIQKVTDALFTQEGVLRDTTEAWDQWFEASEFKNRDQADDLRRMGLSVSELTDLLRQGSDGLKEFTDLAIAAGEVQVDPVYGEDLLTGNVKVIDSFKKEQEAIQEAARAQSRFLVLQEESLTTMDYVRVVLEHTEDGFTDYTAVNAELARMLGYVVDEHGNLIPAANAARAKIRELTDAANAYKDALQAIDDQEQALVDQALASFSADLNAAEQVDRQRDAIERYNEAVAGVSKAVEQSQRDQAAANRAVADAERDLVEAHRAVADAQRDVNKAREEARERIEDLRISIQSLNADEQEGQAALNRARMDAEAARTDKLGAQAQAEADAEVAQAEARLAEIREERGDAQSELADRERVGIEGSEEVREAQERVADAVQAVADAQVRVQEASVRAAEVAEEAAKRQEDAVKAVEQAQRDLQRQALTTAAAQAQAMAEANGGYISAEQNVRAQITALEGVAAQLAPGSQLRNNIEAYIEVLKGVEREITTEFKMTVEIDEALQRLNDFFQVLNQNGMGMDIPALPGGSGIDLFPAKAGGGMLDMRQPTLVGEEGPELVQRVAGGLRVLSNPQTRHAIERKKWQFAPKFHSGGGIGFDPSREVRAVLERGEGVVSADAMGSLDSSLTGGSNGEALAQVLKAVGRPNVEVNALPHQTTRELAEDIAWSSR